MSFRKFVENSKILIFVGTGGVGKTTAATATALFGAAIGKKVLILTLDPSLRLKSTLKLKENKITTITENELGGFKLKGSLDGGLLSPKQIFDEFLTSSGNSELAARLIDNRLYQELSTKLSQSQDFTSIEKLVSAVESEKYDLIILDTAPAQHALDFLRAPDKIYQLFEDSITKWFRFDLDKASWIQKAISIGATQALKLLEFLTGKDFVTSLKDFFQSIQAWQPKLRDRITKAKKIISQKSTQFVLVSRLDGSQWSQITPLKNELKNWNQVLSAIILNRSKPTWYPHLSESTSQPELRALMVEDYEEKQKAFHSQVKKKQANIFEWPDWPHLDDDLKQVLQISDWLVNSKE